MLILPPFTVGDTATLYAPRDYSCEVTDPEGQTFTIDAPVKRVDIRLTKVGTWRYEFSDGTTGELVAVESDEPAAVVP